MTSNDGDTSANLHHGESSPPSNEGINDPLHFVERFRKHRERSVREVVLSATAISDGILSIRNDTVQLARYLGALADAKVISKAEAEKADLSKMPMISKIKKIDEHQALILHPKISDKLCTGYSVLYELGLLIDALPKDGDRAAILNEHLKTLDGDLTRKWIVELRTKIAPKPTKAPKKKPDEIVEPTKKSDEDAVVVAFKRKDSERDLSHQKHIDKGDPDLGPDEESREGNESDVATTVGEEPIVAGLLVVTEKNGDDIFWASGYSSWHRIADKMARDSVVLIFAPLKWLLENTHSVGTFGCPKCVQVFHLTERGEPTLTDCYVLTIFTRGQGVDLQNAANVRLDDTYASIAEQLLESTLGRRLQICADPGDAVEGWEELALEEIMKPHLRKSSD